MVRIRRLEQQALIAYQQPGNLGGILITSQGDAAKNRPPKMWCSAPWTAAACCRFRAMQTNCEPGGIGTEKPDETLAYPLRSRLLWGKRQQAAAVKGLRREADPNARFILAVTFSKPCTVLLRIFLFLSLALPAQAEEKPGATIYQRLCTACHGENGGGNVELKSPPIAGLPQWYVSLQLERFRKDLRGAHPEDVTGAQMAAIAKTLAPEAVAEVALHVSEMKQTPAQQQEDADTERGKELYMEACAACHRFNASGEQAFRSPPLSGFPAWYLRSQYEKFQTGHRGAVANDEDGAKMRIIAATKFPDADLLDIIGFITGLADRE